MGRPIGDIFAAQIVYNHQAYLEYKPAHHIPKVHEFFTFIEMASNNLLQGIASGTTTLRQRPAGSIKAHVAIVSSSQLSYSMKGTTIVCQLCSIKHCVRVHKCQRFINLQILIVLQLPLK